MEFLARSGILSFPLLVCLGCTVYTQCPRDDDDDRGNTGGSSNEGGFSNGGSGNVSGSGIGGALPNTPWTNVTGELIELQSECGNLTSLFAKPDEDVVLAGIALNGLWANRGDDDDWEPLGQGEGSVAITNRPAHIVFDPADGDTFWESGHYNGPGLFKTTDNGETFQALGSLVHMDNISVDFDDPRRRTLLASGHESALVYRSTDGGETWEDFSPSLPEEANPCVSVHVVNATTYLVGCSQFGDKLGGIFRTADEGESWERVSEPAAAFSMPRVAPDGSLYWAADNSAGIVKSADAGKTFSRITPAGVVVGMPAVLPDGRLAAVAQDNSVVVSADDGKTWKPATSRAPFRPTVLAYAQYRKAFYIGHNDCSGMVLPDAIMRFDFDYETE